MNTLIQSFEDAAFATETRKRDRLQLFVESCVADRVYNEAIKKWQEMWPSRRPRSMPQKNEG